MRRDSQSKGSKLAPPEGGSRAGSPDLSGGKSPSSGRSTPSKSPTPVDEKAKSIINKTSDTDKVMAQFVTQEGEEGGKARGGSDASAAPTAAHTRSSKPPVEDRALQAVLAARRRSLENAGKAEPVGGGGVEGI
ncbi:uncharacterized protein [Procambarus clarkii]|uniref:uncharacterized protein n=1 Tax=Procambarus clarkii TaxID=6728 RepID=UPI003742A4DD